MRRAFAVVQIAAAFADATAYLLYHRWQNVLTLVFLLGSLAAEATTYQPQKEDT